MEQSTTALAPLEVGIEPYDLVTDLDGVNIWSDTCGGRCGGIYPCYPQGHNCPSCKEEVCLIDQVIMGWGATLIDCLTMRQQVEVRVQALADVLFEIFFEINCQQAGLYSGAWWQAGP